MSDVKNLLKNVIDKDGAQFTSHLNDMVVDRISDKLESRKMEIASSFIKPENKEDINESVELDEGTYTFKKSSDAYNFMKAATEAGLKKNFLKMKGKSVTVMGVKDKDMIQMLGLIAKDMKGKVSESISNILNSEEGEQVVFEDGSSRFITKNEANCLAEIHDSLNSDEREDFINKISESSDIVETLLKHIN